MYEVARGAFYHTQGKRHTVLINTSAKIMFCLFNNVNTCSNITLAKFVLFSAYLKEYILFQ